MCNRNGFERRGTSGPVPFEVRKRGERRGRYGNTGVCVYRLSGQRQDYAGEGDADGAGVDRAGTDTADIV